MGEILMEKTTLPHTNTTARQPNELERNILRVIREILQGRIQTCMEIGQQLPKAPYWWRDNMEVLLNTFVHHGEERFWLAYQGLCNCHPEFEAWRSWLTAATFPPALPTPPAVGATAGMQVPETPLPEILLSEVQPRAIHWLWQPRLALGKITILDGDPGVGKSMLTLDLAARVSRGWVMPDTTPGLGEPAGVVLISPENDDADGLHPNLRRAGADLSRVASLATVPFTDAATGLIFRRRFHLAEDLLVLSEVIDRRQARLLIIDPISEVLGGKDTYRDNEVRAALAPLQMLLEEKGVACVLVRHLNKGSSGGNVLYRGQGSIAFVALARSAMMVVRDPYDARKSVLLHTKCNIGKLAPQLCFSVQTGEPPEDTRPHVHWHGECHYSDEELSGLSHGSSDSSNERKPNTARDEILRVLEEHAPEAMSPTDISEELPDMSFNTIRSVLSRLVKDGEIEQISRGKYELTTA